MKRVFFMLFPLISLAACASPSIDGNRYLENAPEFQLEEFFKGDVKAFGIVQDRSGNLLQMFEADIAGTFEDGVLTLDETFTYSLGEGVEERVWTITGNSQTGYSGGAGDILGEASGAAFGNALVWSYQMDLPVGEDSYLVTFEDWIWALDDKRIMNRSYIKKFGIVFAEVTIFMEKTTGS